MKTEPFTNNVIAMDVYRGGISRIKNGELEQFEFAADAKTGTIVELIKNVNKTRCTSMFPTCDGFYLSSPFDHSIFLSHFHPT